MKRDEAIEAIEACRWLKERYLDVGDDVMAAECRDREKRLLGEVYGPPFQPLAFCTKCGQLANMLSPHTCHAMRRCTCHPEPVLRKRAATERGDDNPR